jgi:hypothetical protein
VNVDVRAAEGVDLVSEAWGLTGVADGSVEEIYSRHMLEHLDPNDGARTLRRWRALLRPGGTVRVIVPDLEFHALQLLGGAQSRFPDQHAHALAGFYGWRVEDRGGSREDAHRWGYTAATLAAALVAAGFADVERHRDGVDGEPWHLNVTARAAG